MAKFLAVILHKKDVIGRMCSGGGLYGSLGEECVDSGVVSDEASGSASNDVGGSGVAVVSDSADGATVVVSSVDEDDDSW